VRFIFYFLFLVFILFIFLFASSGFPLTWDEGEVLRRVNELPDKWKSAAISNEGHPQLPIILAATGKSLLPQKIFTQKFRLRFFSLFFVSISLTFLFYRLWCEFNFSVAFFSIFSIFLIPRLFAVFQISAWDSCLIASWICCLSFFPLFFRSIFGVIIFGFFLGLAFSSKFSGFAVPFPFLIWTIFFMFYDESLRKIRFIIFRRLFIVTIISIIVFFLFNPQFWFDPFNNVFRFFSLNIGRDINIPVMFLGQIYDLRRPLPFYNTIFWTIITAPLGLLFFFLIGCASILCNTISFDKIKCNENSNLIFSGRRFGLLLFLNMSILLLIRMFPGLPVHDGVRLFAGSFVFLGIIAGIGASEFWQSKKFTVIFVTKNILPRFITIIIFAITLFNMFWYAPQWLSFYNFTVGGLAGAVKIGMEATYYWDGFDDEVIEWLNKNTNKDELILFSKFSPDTFSIYREDGVLKPQFYVMTDYYSDKNNSNSSGLTKADQIRFYVTQNRAGLQTNVDLFFKRNAKPVFVKTIRKGGLGAWNLGNVPIIEIYDVKKLDKRFKRTLIK
jgi:hypothetical protein